MKKQIIFLCSMFIVLSLSYFSVETCYAVSAYPKPIQYVQPDGTSITILLKGDEFVHWAVTPDGYTVLSNKQGAYEYATLSADGKLGFSGIQVNNPDSRGKTEQEFLSRTPKGVFFSKAQINDMKGLLNAGGSTRAPLTGGFPTTGTRKLLVILANFNNTTTTYTQTNFNNYMNQANYNGTGSFRDYYLEVSYGQLTVNTTVTVWVTVPNTHDYYGPEANWGLFALDAVTAANNQTSINFAEFDNNSDGVVDGVAIFHQGRGQEESGNTNDIWSHSWELSSAGYSTAQRTFDGVLVDSYTTMPEKNAYGMGTIGVMCHEFGHNLGAPDFYDTDYSTSGSYDGTGDWDLMASGSWNGNSGDKPAHHNAYTKAYVYGWTTPTVLSAAQVRTLRNAETYTDVVRYNTTTSNEYFLCEDRQLIGFDAGIPGHGMIIYHVDGSYISAHSSANNINAGSHQGMYPVCASSTGNPPSSYGTINGTGCPYPGTGGKTSFTDATTPHSHSWAGANTGYPINSINENTTTKEVTFCFISCASPTLLVSPSNQAVLPPAGTTTFNVTTTAAWTAVSNQAWCTVTPSGTGNGVITATYTQNSTGASRVANITVTISGASPVVVTVTQATPSIAVTPSNQAVTYPAGTTTFAVTSNLSWTATSSQIWCSVTSSGTGDGTITATYTVNLTVSQRVANITVTAPGLTPVVVTVTQAAGLPTLGVTPSNQNVAAASGTTPFAVVSNTTWTATSSQAWCIVTPSGTGNGTLTAAFTQNPTASSRVANITVTVTGLAPVVVTVTQAAPTLSVTPGDQAVTYVAGNTTFSVTSNSNWTVSSSQSWCTVTSSGSGNGTLTAPYELNTSATPRVANVTVTVAGLTPVVVTVTQAGAPSAEFYYTIMNDVQTSDRTLEFDLYLLDTQPATPLELSIIQAGILVNSSIINGGTITTSIVPGYSDLVTLQQPTSALWVTGTPNGCVKITPKSGPGCGSGTIISTTGNGTRICRVRITNSVPFTASTQANLTFTFTTSPYPTKVFQYTGTPCLSQQMTTNSTNCFFSGNNPVLNGPPVLSVSPSDQPVSSPAGSIPFGVTSNAAWTATSNQSWCTVTPSGFGNGTITANFNENTDASPRVASITVAVSGLTPVVVTVTQAGAPIRTCNLSVFLEGLYAGLNSMNPAMDESGFHWGPTIADKLTIELHSGSNYSSIVYTATNVSLNTNGTASFTLPSIYNGSYYVAIRQRNHILTTTANPVSFNSSMINYNFDAQGKAFGGNLGLMIDGKYVFYAGDVNQDGIVDGSDLSDIANLSDIAAGGYVSEDVNGDGLVDGSDLSIAGNNADIAVGSMTP